MNSCVVDDSTRQVPVELRNDGGWPIFALHHPHGGCPILAFFARVGGDAACALILLWTRDQTHLAAGISDSHPSPRTRRNGASTVLVMPARSKPGPPAQNDVHGFFIRLIIFACTLVLPSGISVMVPSIEAPCSVSIGGTRISGLLFSL